MPSDPSPAPLFADALAWARATCLELPRTTTDQPFGEGAHAFRIHGRLFGLLTHAPHVSPHPLLNVKADPPDVPLLVRTHAWVLPGWHMNKRHWVSVVLGPGTDLALAADLVADSYDAVVAGLTLRVRRDLGLRSRTD